MREWLRTSKKKRSEHACTLNGHRCIDEKNKSKSVALIVCSRNLLCSSFDIFCLSLGDLIRFSFYYVTKMARIVTESMNAMQCSPNVISPPDLQLRAAKKANNLKCERSNERKPCRADSENKEVVEKAIKHKLQHRSCSTGTLLIHMALITSCDVDGPSRPNFRSISAITSIEC